MATNCKSNRIMGLTVLLFFMVIQMGFGQKDKPFSETVDIVRSYKPKLADANKMDITPLNEKMDIQNPVITYITVPKVLNPPLNNVKIPPVSLQRDKTISLDHFYACAGVGNYSNILFDFDYNTTVRKNDLFALNLKHNSGKSTPINSNFSEDQIRLSGHKFIGKKTLAGKLYMNNNRVHYYGYNDTLDFAKDTLLQNYLDIGLNAHFSNELASNEKTKYSIDGNFYNLSDALKSNEFCIGISGIIEQKFQSNPIRFELSNTYFNHKYVKTNNRNVFSINALYLLQEEKFNARIGFRVTSESDSSINKFHFYPNVIFEGTILENSLNGFVGLTGGLDNVSYRSITRENPYVEPGLDIRNTNNQFEIQAGLKGNIARKVSFMIKASFKNVENLYFYLNDSLDTKKFVLYYDPDITPVTNLHVEATIGPIKNLNFFLSGNYFNYSTKLSKPWHRPDYDATLSARYSLQKKIVFNVDLFAIGKRYAWDYKTKTAIELKNILDLNAGFTYNFSNKFGVFFNFNNILSEKYAYWNNYEFRGFNMIGGIKLNF